MRRKRMTFQQYETLRAAILERDSYRCQSCGLRKELDVHHIIPRGRGGSDNPDNLITLCRRCHHNIHVMSYVKPSAAAGDRD